MAVSIQLCAAKPVGNYDATDFERVSLIALIADPARFHSKKILVEGILRFEFECQGLFLNEADAKRLVTMNAAWLDLDEKILAWKTMRGLSGKWVTIIGIVDAKDTGHMGMFSLRIKNIAGANSD